MVSNGRHAGERRLTFDGPSNGGQSDFLFINFSIRKWLTSPWFSPHLIRNPDPLEEQPALPKQSSLDPQSIR